MLHETVVNYTYSVYNKGESMNAKELEKILIREGWYFIRQSGSHRHYRHPDKDGTVTVPFHGKKDLNIKTANTILKQAGIKKVKTEGMQ